MRKYLLLVFTSIAFLFSSCKSSEVPPSIDSPKTVVAPTVKEDNEKSKKNTITLLFGGDIMAHNENYNISSFDKIWKDITPLVSSVDFAFANIESPIDPLKNVSSYPNFNMNKEYIQAAIDCGFNVFSLCNNHTNDQGLEGILETQNSMISLSEHNNIYFSGLRANKEEDFTYNVIEKKNWKIVFLPITEILNHQTYIEYINYSRPNKKDREKLFNSIKKIRNKEKCDLFILSLHTYEPEYVRSVTEEQENYYMDLLDSGIDIIMANHTHLIKDRKVVVDTKTNSDKLIMYANGNIISGQRRNPNLTLANPNLERDNTGDGLLYKVTLSKDKNGRIEILKAEPIFITTYINTAHEFIIKKMDDNFINYLYDVGRIDWAKYITNRIRINNEETKDLIQWR